MIKTPFDFRLWHSRSGAVAPIIALLCVALILVIGIGVDIGRMYLVRVKGQNALDGSLLAAANTASSLDVETEARRIFHTNFPNSYLDSINESLTFTINAAENSYEGELTVDVPMTFTKLTGVNFRPVTVRSRVVRGDNITKNVEIALALDSTGSMGAENKMPKLKEAATTMVNILYGIDIDNEKLSFSVVPFDVKVNIGTGRSAWIKSTHVGGFTGTASTRDNYWYPDSMPINPRYDYDLRPPVDDNLKFYSSAAPGTLQPILFASQDQATTLAAIDALTPSGETRVNIGAMFGLYSLDHFWQGFWDASRRQFPRTANSDTVKVLVILTDGRNTVYRGGGGCLRELYADCPVVVRRRYEIPCEYEYNDCVYRDGVLIGCTLRRGTRTPEADGKCWAYDWGRECRSDCRCNNICLERYSYTNDDDSLLNVCRVAADYGIDVMTITVGSTVDQNLMRRCASRPNYYFHAPTADDLERIFQQLADLIILKSRAIRLAE